MPAFHCLNRTLALRPQTLDSLLAYVNLPSPSRPRLWGYSYYEQCQTGLCCLSARS